MNTTELPKLPTLPLGKYRHYKGGEYEVLGVALQSETLTPVVVYRALYDNEHEFWVRPYDMFVGMVDVSGKLTPRFLLIEPLSR